MVGARDEHPRRSPEPDQWAPMNEATEQYLDDLSASISLCPDPQVRQRAINALVEIEERLRIEDRAAMPMSVPRSPQWGRVRAEHLERFPSCAACGTAKDLDVHHVQCFSRHPQLELDPDNLITLCSWRNCHVRIGHSFLWSATNPHVVEDAARQLSRINHRMVG